MEMEEGSDPMLIEDEDSSRSSSSVSNTEIIELRFPEKKMMVHDFVRIFSQWIFAETLEEKNDCFLKILIEWQQKSVTFEFLMDCLKEAAAKNLQAPNINSYISTFFEALLAFNQIEIINAHLYKQDKNVIYEFMAKSLKKFPDEVKSLILNNPVNTQEVRKIKQHGLILLIKFYIEKKEDEIALNLTGYHHLYASICFYILSLFNNTCRTKMDMLNFCCSLVQRYPKVLNITNNSNILKECLREVILEYGVFVVAEAIPQELKGKFSFFSIEEIQNLHQTFETNNQEHLFGSIGLSQGYYDDFYG
jgi:hypothetical protein